MRTIIDLPDDQIEGLEEFCARQHISRAAAVRLAVKELLEKQEQDEHDRVVDAAFGSWASMGVSTDDYLAEIRKEWEH